MSTLRSTAVVAALLVSAATAQAALTVYSGLRQGGPVGEVSGAPVIAKTQFLANFQSVGVETFSGFQVGDGQPDAPLTASFAGVQDPLTASLVGDNRFIISNVQGLGAGRFDTTGPEQIAPESRMMLEVESDLTISFSRAVQAFGFYVTDLGEFDNALVLTLTSSDGTTVVRRLGGANLEGSLAFWGFVEDDPNVSYVKVAITNTSTDAGQDFFAIDDLLVGGPRDVAVPEPATLALIGAGLAMAGFSRVRRRLGVTR